MSAIKAIKTIKLGTLEFVPVMLAPMPASQTIRSGIWRVDSALGLL
ncbi:MAG: hypothetical protein ACUVQ6_06330 [Dissulfurimicrobium sp.]